MSSSLIVCLASGLSLSAVAGALVTGAASAAVTPAAVSGLASDTGPAAGSTQVVDRWGDFGSDGPVSKSADSPTPVARIPADITQISATNSDTYMLTSSGQVWVYGTGKLGQLGTGTLKNSFNSAVEVDFPAGVTIASLPSPMPYSTALAIDTKGNVWGWGTNKAGELCLGSTAQVDEPVQLPFANVTTATGAGGHATYDAGGTLYSCGLNDLGQLGTGNTRSSLTPVPVLGAPGGTVETLTSGYGSTGALLADGTYWDWGLNARGQLGDGNETNATEPVEVSLPAAVSKVAEGGNTANDGQTLVELSTGAIEGWGADQYGQLCNGSTSAGITRPTTITPPSGTTWVDFSSAGASSYAIDSKGDLWACGENNDGEIGDGVRGNVSQVTPIDVLSDVTQVSGTSRNIAALTAS